VTVPVLLFFGVSGAHLNPVLTAALAIDREFPRREVGPYMLAQFAGAFAGSATVLVLLGRAGRLGSTVPLEGQLPLAFVAELSFTFLLAFSVFAIARRGPGSRRWRLLLPGAVVGLSTYLIGPLTGSSLNPARTLAPAVLSGTFQGLWLYFLAVPLGALLAVPTARVLDR
jgi:aquaporin Z